MVNFSNSKSPYTQNNVSTNNRLVAFTFKRNPSAPVALALSLPAKSTKLNLLTYIMKNSFQSTENDVRIRKLKIL